MKKLLCVMLLCLLPFAALAEGWSVEDIPAEEAPATQAVTICRSDVIHGGLLLVNSDHARPADFDEINMLPLYAYARESGLSSFWDDTSCRLYPTAIDALMEMLRAAEKQGYNRFIVQKGYSYRSCEEQEQLFTRQLELLRGHDPDMPEAELINRACQYVSFPGTSEFNTGLSFCLYLYERTDRELRSYYRNTPFYDTPDGQWLLENAWKYGFVFRFPVDGYPTADAADKSPMTGVSSHLNCYRYVGKGHAAVMHHLDLCLEEYIEYLMDHPHIAVYEDGVMRYEIVRQEVGSAEVFDVYLHAGGLWMGSLDNMGGVIIVYEY